MGRVKVSSLVVTVLASALVGFWSWVLAIPVTVPDCPSRPAVGAVCLADDPVRVDTVLPEYRWTLGLKVDLGPTYGMTVSGLPGGIRTVYVEDDDGMDRLDPRPGRTLTAHVLAGNVERLSDTGGSAWVSGYSPGYRYGWIVGTVVAALLLVLLARMDRREVRAPRAWWWADRGVAVASFGSGLALLFDRGRVEMVALVVCFGLLLAVETAGQHWRAYSSV